MTTAGKSIIAFLYALAVVIIPFLDGGHAPTATEYVQIAIAATTAAGVYLAPIIPQAPWTKSAVGALLAGLQILVTVIDNGVNGADVLMIVTAVAGALGIYLAPAVSTNRAAVTWGRDAYALAG